VLLEIRVLLLRPHFQIRSQPRQAAPDAFPQRRYPLHSWPIAFTSCCAPNSRRMRPTSPRGCARKAHRHPDARPPPPNHRAAAPELNAEQRLLVKQAQAPPCVPNLRRASTAPRKPADPRLSWSFFWVRPSTLFTFLLPIGEVWLGVPGPVWVCWKRLRQGT
jgi:hypothetical protein